MYNCFNLIISRSRMIRKAKRVNRTVSLSEEGKHGGSGGAAATANGAAAAAANNNSRMMKNSRKSRSGLGRGLPKKGERIDEPCLCGTLWAGVK